MLGAAVIAAVLITQSAGGHLGIVQNLEPHACEEARCIALWGMACEDRALSQAQLSDLMKQQADAWDASHPADAKLCKAPPPTTAADIAKRNAACGQRRGLDLNALANTHGPGDINTAICVPQ